MSSKSGADINVTPLIDVLLVLLIIFLVVMPVALHLEPIQVPPKLDEPIYTAPTDSLVVKVLPGDLEVIVVDNDREAHVASSDLLRTLRPRVSASVDKVVFVDVEDGVAWGSALAVVDSLRSLDDIKVAVKLR